MSTPWPPPPDLDSIRELVRDADTEDFIRLMDAPADEYDSEASAFLAKIRHLPTVEITVATMLPILEAIWSRSFDYDADVLEKSRPKLIALATQVSRFFGPEAQPQVRQT